MLHVFPSRHPAVGEDIIRKEAPRNILTGMERKRMIFREEPHDVVPLLRKPVAVAEHAFFELF